MSGSTIPYQLRPNKAVDRYIFIDLLIKLNRLIEIEKSHYVGFGSFALEDFKYLHTHLGIQEMTSLEIDRETFKRQKFNMPLTCINAQNISSTEYINDYVRQSNYSMIIWLDYTMPKAIRFQIEEFQSLLLKSNINDVIKLTLNANATSYYEKQSNEETKKQIEKNRQKKLQNKLGELYPSASIQVDMMSKEKFPEAMSKIVEYAAALILQGNQEKYFQPLTIFSYADGQTMLTVTGILLNKEDKEDFLQTTQIHQWEIANTQWSKPRSINLPNFTLQEKIFVDSMLPNSDALHIQEALGFQFTKNTIDSQKMIQNYIDFYRYQPFFSRIIF